MSGRAYLDWNATAPLRPQARDAMFSALDAPGNPSSLHQDGRRARQIIEQARAQVATLVGAEPRNVTFTAGGTEANAMALTPHWQTLGERRPSGRLLVSAIEHPSVLAGGRFGADAVSQMRVTPGGVVNLRHLESLIEQAEEAEEARILVSIMVANNESGAIQPIREAAALVHAAGGLLHVDAAQAAGRIALDIHDLGADLLTLSAHKLGGPQGVGALVRRDAALHLADPLMRGGGQERGARAGTENVAGIAGFGAAAEAAQRAIPSEADRLRALRDRLEAGLRQAVPATVVFSSAADRLPNTTLFATPGIKAETALIALDLAGVAVSSGSACSSGKVAPSHVLAAMGVAPSLASGAIRASFGYATTEREIDCLIEAWRNYAERLGKGGREIAA